MFGDLAMTQKKMGKMTSLSKLSGIKSKQPEPEITTPEPQPEVNKSEEQVTEVSETKAKVGKQNPKKKKQEKLVTVNIKIRKDQKDWLTDTASKVRDNNTDPVPPSQRVYPQHLIGVAIDLLQNVDIDWGEVKNVEELREQLNL